MKHTAHIVPDSLEETHMHGLAFVVRCCNDPKTDIQAHIQNAGDFSPEELVEKIKREWLEPHALGHQRWHAVKSAQLALIKSEPLEVTVGD